IVEGDVAIGPILMVVVQIRMKEIRGGIDKIKAATIVLITVPTRMTNVITIGNKTKILVITGVQVRIITTIQAITTTLVAVGLKTTIGLIIEMIPREFLLSPRTQVSHKVIPNHRVHSHLIELI